MPRLYGKKLALIGNASVLMTEGIENLEKASLDQKLETVKVITSNIKLNKGNEDLLTLINSRIEANLISRGYSGLLPLKILDILWSLATINKHQIRKQRLVISWFEISDSTGRTRWFEETFLVENIPQSVV